MGALAVLGLYFLPCRSLRQTAGSAPTSAATQPMSVQPSRTLSAKIALRFECLRLLAVSAPDWTQSKAFERIAGLLGTALLAGGLWWYFFS